MIFLLFENWCFSGSLILIQFFGPVLKVIFFVIILYHTEVICKKESQERRIFQISLQMIDF